ncbi:MAG: tRNA uracil 4-sulfurtransferase [Thermoplasmata archaeon]|nr:tRNA uracil 4-sulfurtransferase [Thermoplasmata archaeon]
MAWPPILVRYGEIGIKSRSVRAQFERRLVECIEDQLVKRGVEAELAREQGRILVRAADTDGALDALRHTFGVVSASPAVQTQATLEAIAEGVLAVAREQLPAGGGFAVRVKRAGTHGFSSLDVAKACAARILDALAERKPHVDLDTPTWEAHVEVRDADAFIWLRKVKGPGGLPLASQGRVGVLVEGPRAAHAAWLVAKRGAGIYLFASDIKKAEAWLAPLAPWLPNLRVRPVEAADRAGALAALAPQLAQHKCQALVLADGAAEQLATAPLDALAGVPVFRPLTGYPGARFAALARDAELPEDA